MKLEFTVPFKEGLHARPASELVKICQKAKSEINLIKGETVVNPKSILGIISLAADFGDKIQFNIEGPDEQEISESLNQFFKA